MTAVAGGVQRAHRLQWRLRAAVLGPRGGGTTRRRASDAFRLGLAAILGVILLLDLEVFIWASRIGGKLKADRLLVIEKVFGFLLAAIAVQLVLDGLASAGVLPHVPH